MSSREYMGTMLDIETTAMGLGNAADYAQELAKKLGYALGKTEGYLQATTPEFLTKFPILIDEQIAFIFSSSSAKEPFRSVASSTSPSL